MKVTVRLMVVSLVIGVVLLSTTHATAKGMNSSNTVKSEFYNDMSGATINKRWILKYIKTPFCEGNSMEAIRQYVIPALKLLATGTLPNDEIRFEEAPLYIEGTEEKCDRARSFFEIMLQDVPGYMYQAVPGIFDLGELEYRVERRKVSDSICHYAITGVSVKSWRSPYGGECPREEALRYHDVCQEKIQALVSKVIAARQSDGEPLTKEQKLKWIHDWLIISNTYAGEKYDAATSDRSLWQQFGHLKNEYGALVDGEAICQGFSYAFVAIIEELVKQTGLDIECEEALMADGTHSWIRVKLDGEWYHIDITADNRFTRLSEDTFVDEGYFLVTDEYLAAYWQKEDQENYYYSVNSDSKATSRKYIKATWEDYKKDLSEFKVGVKDPTIIYSCRDNISSRAIEIRYGKNVLSPKSYKIKRVCEVKKVGTLKVISSVLVVTPVKYSVITGQIEIPGSRIVKILHGGG